AMLRARAILSGWLLLLVVGATLHAEDAPISLRWTLEEYDKVRYDRAPAGAAAKKTCSFYARDIQGGAAYVGEAPDIDSIPLPFIFSLPEKAVKAGAKLPVKRVLDKVAGVAPFSVAGTWTAVGLETKGADRLFHMKGAFKCADASGAAADDYQYVVAGGELAAETWFNLAAGVVARATAALSLDLKATGSKKAVMTNRWRGSPSRPGTDGFVHVKCCHDYTYRETRPYRGKDFEPRVAGAIDKGCGWLKTIQNPDGTFGTANLTKGYEMGYTALATFTLLWGGVPADDPVVKKAFAWLDLQPFTKTYSTALYVLALEARFTPPAEAGLIAQGKVKEYKRPLTPEAKTRITAARKWLVDNMASGRTWGYPEGSGDNSNAQYGVLALAAADRCGFATPGEVWMRIAEHAFTQQEARGPAVADLDKKEAGARKTAVVRSARGFGYVGPSGATGSMTTAGIAMQVIARQMLDKHKHPKYDAAFRARLTGSIDDGFTWLRASFSVTTNPGLAYSSHHYYYLYGLERAGVLAARQWIGPFDWYYEGAEFLLDAQRSDGAWAPSESSQPAYYPDQTCFAILFLKRATVPPIVTTG
ncbi:MAG: hypothetical protein HY719_05475, partial [Planctomycetes bacterium]|nr:hypothetical protein [Planctomycetota bacterium]